MKQERIHLNDDIRITLGVSLDDLNVETERYLHQDIILSILDLMVIEESYDVDTICIIVVGMINLRTLSEHAFVNNDLTCIIIDRINTTVDCGLIDDPFNTFGSSDFEVTILIEVNFDDELRFFVLRKIRSNLTNDLERLTFLPAVLGELIDVSIRSWCSDWSRKFGRCLTAQEADTGSATGINAERRAI